MSYFIVERMGSNTVVAACTNIESVRAVARLLEPRGPLFITEYVSGKPSNTFCL